MEHAGSVIERAVKIYEKHGRKIRLLHSFYYQAKSWERPRRVAVKAEISENGKNIRFIAAGMEAAKAGVLYDQIYCARGKDELYIKEHKLHLKSDRTSCHRFEANPFRLFLHSAAYVLIHTLKTGILGKTPFADATFETVQLRLLKIGAGVRELKTRIKIELPSSFPLKNIVMQSFQIFNCLRI